MIIRLKRVLRACIFASAPLTTLTGWGCQHYFSAAHAATYYVETTGNNSNPGTKNSPFRTIAYAVDIMIAGDTTYVRGGVYNEDEIRFRRTGTSSAPIRLLNYPNESPIINFADQSPYHRILVQNGSGYNRAIGWITLEGFEIRNGFDGFKASNLHDTVIRRNWIHGHRNQGTLVVGGARVLFDSNIFSHNGPFATKPNSNLAHGLYAHGSAMTITNNLFYDNLAYGITQNGSSSSVYSPVKHADPEFSGAADWIIANNTFAYNKNRGGIVVWGSECTNGRIENNIFYENSVSTITVQGVDFSSASASTGIMIRNNLFFASGSGGLRAIGGGTLPSDLVFTGNIVNVSGPAFVNAPAELPTLPNFSLTAQSPAIDRGLPPPNETPDKTLRTAFDNALLRARLTDFAGTSRPQGRAYDIGAYEYRPDGDTQSPTTVQNVQIR